jgi:Zn finger protein HypA/HybF involved in hydrogenase expression
MPINFKCPHCQSPLQAVSNLSGKQGRCPKCNKEVTVPQDAGSQSEQKETSQKETN